MASQQLMTMLVGEGAKSSSGTPWGDGQKDGRVVMRALVRHGIEPVTRGEPKFDDFLRSYRSKMMCALQEQCPPRNGGHEVAPTAR